MKIAALIIGILLMVLAGIGGIVCLLLPSMTNNRISLDEAALGLIPAVLVFIIGFLIAVISAIFVIKARKNAGQKMQ